MAQIVKVNRSKAVPLDVSLRDKVSDVVKTDSEQRVYVTCASRMIRGSDELKSCGVGDGSTVQVMSTMRGGEKFKGKKSKAETKQAASPWRSEPLLVRKEVKDAKEPKSDKGPAIQERDKGRSDPDHWGKRRGNRKFR